MKDKVEVAQSIPQECVQCVDKQVVKVPVSQIQERIVQTGMVVSQESLVEWVEETVEAVPQSGEKRWLVEVKKSSRILKCPFKYPRKNVFLILTLLGA